MPAIDVFLLNHSMTILPYSNSGSPRAKRDGKFEAEDCVCLSSFYRRWPHPPVCRPHLNPFVGFDPGVGLSDNAAAILAPAISPPQGKIMITLDTNGEIVVTLGNADPNDQHLAGRIVAVDDAIIAWLTRRERRQVERKTSRLVTPRRDCSTMPQRRSWRG